MDAPVVIKADAFCAHRHAEVQHLRAFYRVIIRRARDRDRSHRAATGKALSGGDAKTTVNAFDLAVRLEPVPSARTHEHYLLLSDARQQWRRAAVSVIENLGGDQVLMHGEGKRG